jgi:hypothetical protein
MLPVRRSVITEQRYLPAPASAKPVMEFYPIDALLKAANYLIRVEDRMLPAAFFAEPRYGFKTAIGFLRQIREWKSEGYTYVLMAHGADPQVSIHQPFGRYYVWEHRLKTLKHIEPVNRPS